MRAKAFDRYDSAWMRAFQSWKGAADGSRGISSVQGFSRGGW
jgi:hypothetical protein